jgi:hypothetical protein
LRDQRFGWFFEGLKTRELIWRDYTYVLARSSTVGHGMDSSWWLLECSFIRLKAGSVHTIMPAKSCDLASGKLRAHNMLGLGEVKSTKVRDVRLRRCSEENAEEKTEELEHENR